MTEMGRLRKNDTTEIVVQKTEFRGSVGIDIREYVTSERYTGWSKNGIRIPVEKWQDFREILGKVDTADKADRIDKVDTDKADNLDTVNRVDSAER
jgi:hypothetical protein